MEAKVVQGWDEQFESLTDRVGGVFPRRDLRRQASGYVRGLLGRVERKNAWQVSEHLGREGPYGIQRLLGRATWDADGLRDEVRRYACGHLLAGDGTDVLIVDETGFLKKGTKSAGVQRQYSGTAGRIENGQVGVFLALSSSKGRALIDRRLYLPESWCEDRKRCREAGIPDKAAFATKPALAISMLKEALDAGIRLAFVLADEVYGSDSKFRRFLDERGQPFVVAVTSQQRLWVDFRQTRVDEIAETLPPENWHRINIADGSKGPRLYEFAAARFGVPTETGLYLWLVIRRHIESGEKSYYLAGARKETTARDLAVAVGQRWPIETCFETAKQETGLGDYEVRSWVGWHRHITLSMLAAAFLTAVRLSAAEVPRTAKPSRSKSPRRGGKAFRR